jgi:hypothetical protein
MFVPEFRAAALRWRRPRGELSPPSSMTSNVTHALPSVDNASSSALCRKLAFELLEACEFEYPKRGPGATVAAREPTTTTSPPPFGSGLRTSPWMGEISR